MYFVRFIILGIPLLSLVWWLWADRRLRNLKTARSVRLCLSFLLLILLGGYCWGILGRRDVIITPIPAGLYAMVLLWGLAFLASK
jgi:hypothetical protein